MRHLKNPWVLAVLVLAGIAGAGTIKTWSIGEVITAAQLNQALQHIHTNMVGGHGARLINADVSGSAAIASTKLADGEMIPWAKATVGAGWETPCTAGDCALFGARNVDNVERTAAGVYTITLSTAIAQPSTILCTGINTTTTCNVYSPVNDGGTTNTLTAVVAALKTTNTLDGGIPAVNSDGTFSVVIWNDGN